MDLQKHALKLQTYLKETNVHETTTLLPELNILAQDFFDAVRSSDFQNPDELSQQVYDVCFSVYSLDHWVRKLTASTVIADLLNNFPNTFEAYTQNIPSIARTLLSNKKREVRDSSARMLANLPEEQFEQVLINVEPKDDDSAEFREALSVMCGYKLSRTHNELCLNYLFQNVNFTGKTSIETNYVHWYTQRAFIKAMLNNDNEEITSIENLYESIKSSFAVDEMKVRKYAADASAIFYALSEENLQFLLNELEQIKKEHMNNQKANYYVQTVLLAASVFVQIITGKHVSYNVSKYTISHEDSIKLQQLLITIYKNINDVFIDQKTLSGMYKGAALIALIPESFIIKQALDTSYVKQIEGALDAIIFMQKGFKQSIDNYRLELLLFNQFHNQSIAVNALRCLQWQKVIENCEEFDRNTYDFSDLKSQEIIDFSVEKMANESPEIRHCACQLLIRYLKTVIDKEGDLITAGTVTYDQLSQISTGIVGIFDSKYSRQQGNQMTLKTTAELMSLIGLNLQLKEVKELTKASQQYFLDRDDCCGQLGKFYCLTFHKKYAQMCLIYAFDAVNIQLSDYCKTFVGIAAKLFDEEEFIEVVNEHFLQDDSENLYLNGVSRLFFGLKTYCDVQINQQLIDLLKEIQEKATDFFDEITEIFKVYQNALTNESSENIEESHQLAITGEEEFDPAPEQTIQIIKQQLTENPNPTSIKEIILSKTGWKSQFAQNTYDQIILDTRIKVELKQLLAAAMLPSNAVFSYEQQIDARRNEVFDFNKING